MSRKLMVFSIIILLFATATSFGTLCGDVDNSGAVNIQDITYLISFLYKGGPAPLCGSNCGDVNNFGAVNIQDITYLINFLYKGGPEPICGCGTIIDNDDNVYKTIVIGDQCWLAENLRVTHYCNGDAIPNVTDKITWTGLTTGAYCEYNNDIKNVATYGRLYNWYAVNDGRNIAPAGWHVASDAEWATLIDYLGGEAVAGGKMKETGTTHWKSPNTGATNESGFIALPGGYRYWGGDYDYDYVTYHAFFWSATEEVDGLAYGRLLLYILAEVRHTVLPKASGFSVRCVKD
jgi:uncharacterized protein (TIGR02145 family)